ncbi:MAG TPA: ATP-dependent DNA helicase UvrD2 [Candidatus Limnocylindrales bacterium]|nr:ATP-dependent DNA helicase UvrD2 [Candidatus Limnocylindrales bacterium]
MTTPVDPARLLDDLDAEQESAVRATTGPVAIHAGAGSGKTRVISRRTAYAIASGVVPADQVLVVTFTDKAATEMVDRLRGLGLPGVTARTFHAHALSQLRHFWPQTHDGQSMPTILQERGLLIYRLARQLPGNYRFTPSKDIADEIGWAKARRITPKTYERETAALAGGREPPIPVDLFVRVFTDYERAKQRTNQLDFDDLLTETVDLLERNPDAARTVRERKRWFSVDEYQDTNPLQQALLELWLGDRDDLCVVGDEDQTIYSFTGATSDYLTAFVQRHPGAREISLNRNYRSSPEILVLANRLLAADGTGRNKQLVATMPSGPKPTIERRMNADAELTFLVAEIRRLTAEGTAPAEIAILVRTNAQIPPIEAALTRARIPFQVRGQRFFDRTEIREAIRLARRLPATMRGSQLLAGFDAALRRDLGFDADDGGGAPGARAAAGPGPRGAEARERTGSLALLLEIAGEAVAARHDIDREALIADFEARAAAEADGSAEGVNLLTLHRAKGLEWDAVFLPQLEDGTIPIKQAETEEAIAEERRLLYVGITRARRYLALSWAERRPGQGDRESRRHPSEFLVALRDKPARAVVDASGRHVTTLPSAPMSAGRRSREVSDPLIAALKAWRLDAARSDGVPAYVVAPDTLLDEIVDQRPTTIAALRRVKGMGPSRLSRYGHELLEIVNAGRAEP